LTKIFEPKQRVNDVRKQQRTDCNEYWNAESYSRKVRCAFHLNDTVAEHPFKM